MAGEGDLLARVQRLEALLNASASGASASQASASEGGYTLNTGDNAWMIVATALVFFMTPGVAFFYGGMVHAKNLLGTLILSYLCMGIVTVQWVLFGYSLAFGPRGAASQIGGGDNAWYSMDFGYITNSFYDATFPLYTHAAFQCAFAVITPALITGVVVNKMKPGSFCIFVLLWTTLVYDVIAFWIWNPQGWLHEYGALDFAGGTVIHISSGFSAMICSYFIRDREAEVEHEPPAQSLPMTVLGGSILWFGWAGFNAGSASSAGDIAALALINTNAAAAAALLTFMALDRLFTGKIAVLGGISGAVAGLVIITPAAGFVRPGWAVLMGIWGTIMVYGGILLKRKWTKIDDPLDVFTCHGMGGLWGSLLTGLFCEAAVNPGGFDGAFYGNPIQLWKQLAAVLVVIAYACAMTAGLCTLLHFTLGLRVSKLEAHLGMDNHLTTVADVDEELLYTDLAMLKVRKALSGEKNVDFTEKEQAHLHPVFSLIDDQQTGRITLPKFLAALRLMNIGLSKDEAAILFKRFDADKRGAIDFAQFRAMMHQANRVSQVSKAHLDDVEMTPVEIHSGDNQAGADAPLVGRRSSVKLQAKAD